VRPYSLALGRGDWTIFLDPTSVHWHGVRPDAGTFWYHAHVGVQIDRGLYAALIVEEAQPVDVDRDIVLMFAVPAGAASSQASVLVNGSPRPDVPLRSGERLRLRLINAITSRGLSLKFEGHAPWIVAIDGQPTEPFLAHEGRVGLGPGLPSKNMKSIKSLISKTVFGQVFGAGAKPIFRKSKSPPPGGSRRETE
jgi:hypothetical protein